MKIFRTGAFGGLFTILVLLATAPIVSSACDMPEGFHEYGTFGEKAVFLYHFPSFGSIHAYQVVVKADLSVQNRNVNDILFSAMKANPGVLFITSPAKPFDGSPDYWVLPDYSRPGVTFNAKVHYRVGGKDHVLFDSVQVKVKDVIFNRLLKSTLIKSANLEYLYFGSRDEAYLLHIATWDPDFDQLLKVNPLNLSPPGPAQNVELTVNDRPNVEANRLKIGESTSVSQQGGPDKTVTVLSEMVEFAISLQQ